VVRHVSSLPRLTPSIYTLLDSVNYGALHTQRNKGSGRIPLKRVFVEIERSNYPFKSASKAVNSVYINGPVAYWLEASDS
jgi:hypothetical protein